MTASSRSAATPPRSTRWSRSISSSTTPSSSTNSARPRRSQQNVELEYERNGERYRFLKWGQGAFDNFRVVPPGTGICHQVNLEYLAQTVWTRKETIDGVEVEVAYPDTVVGTDSHTTMVNGLAVLGWGVGGIEAEAAMLGQPQSMLLPEVIGFKLTGKLKEGITATDLVLTVTQMLRKKGVVGKFVEFFGPGLYDLTLADRATIANMGPEYGATCGFFPVDAETLELSRHDRPQAPTAIALVEAYSQGAGPVRHDRDTPDPVFTDTLELDLSTVQPSMAGPKRPEGRVDLNGVAKPASRPRWTPSTRRAARSPRRVPVEGKDFDLGHGDVVIAAITSCTNTSNPSVLMAAGLLARNAVAKGLKVKPWVKTSLAPGSQVVAEYLAKAGLQTDLDALGFNLVGFGCTTCIGNSGPLPAPISKAINEQGLIAGAVISGNRNFEGRVSPDVQANYLASPPLVVAYALAGSVQMDLTTEPLGIGQGRQAGLPQGHLALQQGDPEPSSPRTSRAPSSRRNMPTSSRATRNWQAVKTPDEPDLCLGGRLDLRPEPALFPGHGQDADAGHRHRRRAHPRPVRRQDHHRPHLAGRLDQGRLARRRVSDRARRRRRRLQPVRHAARQSRGDDARHLRQHPHPQPHDGPQRARGRLHHPLSEQGRAADLRRRDALPGRRRCRWSSSPASNTATAPRATGRRRAPTCSASRP